MLNTTHTRSTTRRRLVVGALAAAGAAVTLGLVVPLVVDEAKPTTQLPDLAHGFPGEWKPLLTDTAADVSEGPPGGLDRANIMLSGR